MCSRLKGHCTPLSCITSEFLEVLWAQHFLKAFEGLAFLEIPRVVALLWMKRRSGDGNQGKGPGLPEPCQRCSSWLASLQRVKTLKVRTTGLESLGNCLTEWQVLFTRCGFVLPSPLEYQSVLCSCEKMSQTVFFFFFKEKSIVVLDQLASLLLGCGKVALNLEGATSLVIAERPVGERNGPRGPVSPSGSCSYRTRAPSSRPCILKATSFK